MVLASHVIFCAYGFWLPNDPRGSWSDFVDAWELLKFGQPIRPGTTRSVAHHKHDRELRLAGKDALKYPPVVFNGVQARSIGVGFATAASEGNYQILACSILPEHVHLVIARHERKVERIVGHLKAAATRQLTADGLHPLAEYARKDGGTPTPWAENCWKVFLDSRADIHRSVEYVDDNPEKERKRRQRWSFVMRGGD